MSLRLKLKCLIEGEAIVFLVTAVHDHEVSSLKELIQSERAQDRLKGIDPHILQLWKPKESNPIAAKPGATLVERIKLLGDDLSTFADKLDASDTVFSIFPGQPPREYIHIIVKVPTSELERISQLGVADEILPLKPFPFKGKQNFQLHKLPPTKQRRQSEKIVEQDVIAFWSDLWVASKNPIRQETVQRDPDCLKDVDIPATFDVLHGLPVSFTTGDLLIRNEYKSVEEDIGSYQPHVNAVVITGHPGIGKSSFLFYLLARRLLARKPTIFQRDATSIYFFSAMGVRLLSHDTVDKSVIFSETWALINAKQEDKTAPIFLLDRSTLFLVIASPPRPSHWRDVRHYRPPIKIWIMEPFELEELIQARQLQKIKCSETSIQHFLQEYGPSARDCYAFCEFIPYYEYLIRDTVKNIAWDTVTDMLTARKGGDDGSHKLILIRPSPTDHSSRSPIDCLSHSLIYRSFPSLSIITKTVARLLHECDSTARWQNARKLYRTLRADPHSRSTAGKLLELPFHALCMKGASFRLFSMNVKPGGGTSWDTFTNDSTNCHTTLTVPPQPCIVFDREHPITTLLANHYYQPTHGTQPSYDSFIFNPEETKFTLFQVTCGLEHPVHLKGINTLIELAAKLGVNDPTLHFVAVVPEGDRVEFPVPKNRGFLLQMSCIEVTENELYNY